VRRGGFEGGDDNSGQRKSVDDLGFVAVVFGSEWCHGYVVVCE
jgi:hypothetical protein